MREKYYLTMILFIIFTIVSSAAGALKENNDEKSSSKLLIRKKRIIDYSRKPTIIESIEELPYMVNIHKNENLVCGAVILSAYYILSAAGCVGNRLEYHVRSASANTNFGVHHGIKRKILFSNSNTTLEHINLALLIISPPIDLLRSPNRKIDLHPGGLDIRNMLGRSTYGTLSGWGCTQLIPYISFPVMLRSIKIPIIDHQRCRDIYTSSNSHAITESNFCTLDPKKKRRGCARDIGGPFTVNGKLLGILTLVLSNAMEVLPDIFVKLSLPAYTQWIISNLRQEPRA